jgi:hypothetical protein
MKRLMYALILALCSMCVTASVRADDPNWSCPCFPASSLPDAIFQAVHRPQNTRPAYGNFKLSGPLEKTLRPLPSDIYKVAQNGSGYLFGMGLHDVYSLSPDLSEAERLMSFNVPELNWTMGITYDSLRDRFLTATLDGDGRIYSYRPNNGRLTWSVVHSLENVDLNAIAYMPTQDRLFGLGRRFMGAFSLFEYDPETGAPISEISTRIPHFRGLDDRTIQFTTVDKYLAVVQYFESRPNPDPTIYLIDPVTNEQWLVVPEPSSVALGLVSLALLAAWKRRRTS